MTLIAEILDNEKSVLRAGVRDLPTVESFVEFYTDYVFALYGEEGSQEIESEDAPELSAALQAFWEENHP